MRNEMIRNVAGVMILYLLIIGGVVALNARMGEISSANNTVSLGK